MEHNYNCTKWLELHPYDCPECKVLNDLEERLEYKHEEDLNDLEDKVGADAYDEGQRDCLATHDDLIDGEFDKGWDAGYAECMKVHNLTEEE
jgi:hypothetical protein